MPRVRLTVGFTSVLPISNWEILSSYITFKVLEQCGKFDKSLQKMVMIYNVFQGYASWDKENKMREKYTNTFFFKGQKRVIPKINNYLQVVQVN